MRRALGWPMGALIQVMAFLARPKPHPPGWGLEQDRGRDEATRRWHEANDPPPDETARIEWMTDRRNKRLEENES